MSMSSCIHCRCRHVLALFTMPSQVKNMEFRWPKWIFGPMSSHSKTRMTSRALCMNFRTWKREQHVHHGVSTSMSAIMEFHIMISGFGTDFGRCVIVDTITNHVGTSWQEVYSHTLLSVTQTDSTCEINTDSSSQNILLYSHWMHQVTEVYGEHLPATYINSCIQSNWEPKNRLHGLGSAMWTASTFCCRNNGELLHPALCFHATDWLCREVYVRMAS